MTKTTRDEISIDLDGTIDKAIATLQRLKKQHPGGRISLESEYEYGESYPRLKLHFTRPKELIELELEKWQEKRRKLDAMTAAAAAYEREGDAYPRTREMEKLSAELGCFAEPRTSLVIFDGQIVAYDMLYGARSRDGTWLFRRLGFDFGVYTAKPKKAKAKRASKSARNGERDVV